MNALYLLNQQSAIGNCEVLVIDFDPDKTGSTAETVRRFTSVYLAPIRIINLPQSGIAYARNVGVNQAKSNIICSLDGDSHYSDSDGLARMIAPILSGEAVMTIPYNFYHDGDPVMNAGIGVANIIQHLYPFHLTGCCIRKDVIISAGGFSDENTSDELGNITNYIRENNLPLKIVNDTFLLKSVRRVKAIVTQFADPKDFHTAYR